jgi:ribosomal protein S19E (S16A)
VLLAVLLRTRGSQLSGVKVASSIYVGPSNRKVSEHAGINDQGQISKLMLSRLEGQGLVENTQESCYQRPSAPTTPTRGVDPSFHKEK